MKDDSRDIEIQISTGTVLRALFIIVGAAVLWYLRDIALIVLTSIVLASAFEPMIRGLMKRKIPRVVSLVLIYLFGGVFLVSIMYFFVPAFLNDVQQISRILPEVVETIGVWDPLQGGSVATEVLRNATQQGATQAVSTADVSATLDALKQGIEKGGALQTFSVFFGGLLSFVLIIVLSFYFAVQERGIEGFLRLIAPVRSRAYIVDLWHRSQQKIGLWFQGQLLLGLLVGVLVFLGLTILGVPSAFFLAVTAAIFEIIPVFGPILAAVPAAVLAYTHGLVFVDAGLTAMLFIILFYFIIQQFESHLIYPLVVRKVIGIPPVLVILALVIGAKVAGFLGILLSVPLTAILMEFLSDVAKEKRVFED